MSDIETFIVKGGIIVLASLTVLRLIVHDVRNLKDDLTGKRKRR